MPELPTKTRDGVSRRSFLATTATLAATTAIGASALPSKSRANTPKKGGTLRFGVGHGSTTDSLDPGTFENNFTIALDYMLHNHMSEITADGDLSGEVAESWESSPDAKVWSFKVRNGMEHHNGKTVTPEDVIASFRHHMGEDTTSAAAAFLKPVVSMKADGSDSVVIELDSGNADFPYIVKDYHMPIMPSIDGKVDPSNGIGCGPYKLEYFEPGVQAKVSRHPNYWKSDRAHFDEVQMLTIADGSARTNAIITEEMDLVDRVDLKTAELLKRKQNLEVITVAGNQHYTFPMLTQYEPFNNNDVRMALKLAVDRQEMVDKILRGYGSVGNDHPIGSSVPFYASDLPQRQYDPDKAKWHVKQSGFGEITVQLSAADAAFSGAVDAATLYQQSAAKAGINIEVVREPNDGYWSNVWTQKPWCACYWNGRATIDAMLSIAYIPGAAWNDTNWDNPRFVELVNMGRAELDYTKRAEIYREAQELLSNDGGTVVPMYANYVFAASKKLGHGKIAANFDMDGQKFAERWWFAS